MSTLPPLPCYLNGEFTELASARVSVMDRGFIFGDGIYEVVPVYGGALFRFDQHLARLQRSLTEVRIKNPMAALQWAEIAHKLVASYAHSTGAEADNSNLLIYIQVTRGVAMRDHVMPTEITPTVFVMVNKMNPASAAQRSQGVSCVTADDFRWQKANIKSVSLLGAVLARQISFDVGASETILFRDGYLSEAAASNVWVVKDGKVFGPPKDNLLLEGVRYGLIEEICRDLGIGFELRRISRAEVFNADELLLSSATKEVLPVTQLDGQTVGRGESHGRPGPIYAKLYAGYQQAIAQTRRAARQASTGTTSLKPPASPPTAPAPTPTAPDAPATKSLIAYPSLFPIKVMGLKVEGLVHAITLIARQFDPTFDAATIELRESKGGKYLGVTITVTATSREQLDELYRTLSTHPMVKVVL